VVIDRVALLQGRGADSCGNEDYITICSLRQHRFQTVSKKFDVFLNELALSYETVFSDRRVDALL